MLYRWYHSKKWINPLIMLLVLILSDLLLSGVIQNGRDEEAHALHLQAYAQQIEEEQAAQEEAQRQEQLAAEELRKQEEAREEQERLAEEKRRQQLKAADSFYQMLADGLDVNILIVGDSIGAGDGASDHDMGWAALLQSHLPQKYHSKVKLTNVSMRGNASCAGYERLVTLNDNVEYDLVILCYGHNDNREGFGQYYESMIRAIKRRYPKASTICFLESSQKKYTEKIQIIQALAAHYSLPVVDTLPLFQEDYDSKVCDKVHPNNLGHQLYYEELMRVIDPLVEERYGYDPADVEPLFDSADVFETFTWIPQGAFTHNGNTYSIPIEIKGTIVALDYIQTSGSNTVKILVDGEEFAVLSEERSHGFSRRYVVVANDWLNGETLDARHEIRVVFRNNEAGLNQAKGFKGLAIIGPGR